MIVKLPLSIVKHQSNIVIISQLATLEQAKYFINQVTQAQYCALVSPHFASSAGTHIRHIVDHYLALKNHQQGVVDYNTRHRFCAIENSKDKALAAIEELQAWLEHLPRSVLEQQVQVVSEISLVETVNCEVQSTIARELMFVSSHAVHHYAMLKLIANLQGVKLDDHFGLAPATLSFVREQQGAKNLCFLYK